MGRALAALGDNVRYYSTPGLRAECAEIGRPESTLCSLRTIDYTHSVLISDGCVKIKELYF